jgi:transposase
MTRKYAAFSKEFKLEALRLAEDTDLSIAQLSRNLGIRRNMIYKWRVEMETKQEHAFKRTASESSDSKEVGNMAEIIAENKRLKQALKLSQMEAEILQMEAEILKKAEAYFKSVKS